MYPPCVNPFLPCAVNPFLPSCAEFSIRGPQTKVVHLTLANESNLQNDGFGSIITFRNNV